MTGSSVEITAPSSGYFTNETDGYETVLSTSMTGTVTVDAVNQLLATQPVADQGQNVGKLMSAAKWYYIAKLSSSDAIRFSKGQTVQLVFHGNRSNGDGYGGIRQCRRLQEQSAILFPARWSTAI